MQIRRPAQADRLRLNLEEVLRVASFLFATIFYIASAVLVGGLIYRVRLYARIPPPLKMPTTPAPTTIAGVALRLIREILLFESLFKASKSTWLFGWLFHFGLTLALLRHLRYVTEPIWGWVLWLQSAGAYAGAIMLIGLAGLWWRRLWVDRVRYISAPSDHLMLALFTALAGSGLALKNIWHTDVAAVKSFFLAWRSFDLLPWAWFLPAPDAAGNISTLPSLPADSVLYIHLGLAVVLLLIFPVSKLLHAPGLFFSPTRNQADNPRRRPHA